jgi:hypothetical protein
MGSNGLPLQAHGQWLIRPQAVVLSLVMCGCTLPVSHLTEAQAAAAAVATPDRATYLLGPEDTLEISVWKEPDLTKHLVVRPGCPGINLHRLMGMSQISLALTLL